MPKGFLQSTFMLNNIHRLSPKQQRAVKRAYYACITQIDYSLGFLFSRLRELNLMDNTYIIFTSDHGDMMGDHHMGAKMTFLEGSAHVPLIIKAPDQSELYKKTKGLRCDNIEELSYLYHTILSIAGISNPSEQTEKVDLTKDFEVKVNREFYGFCQDATNTYSVMDGQYKYLYTEAFGQELLFDLQNDPMEQVNLAAQPDFQPIVSTFRSKLSQWALQYHPELICPPANSRSLLVRNRPKSQESGPVITASDLKERMSCIKTPSKRNNKRRTFLYIEESPPFFVYRIKSRFSVKRRNPNPSPTWKIQFGFLSFGPSIIKESAEIQ